MGNGVYNLDPSLDATRDHVLYDDGNHKVIYLGTQGMGKGDVEVNSYLIIDNNRGLLVDPGGYKIFAKVISNISKYLDPKNIDYIYMCHQDPDVAGSIPLWRKISNAKIVVHWLWVRFLPHFGFEDVDSVAHPLPDEGERLNLGSAILEFIPAHFLHSPGHFSIYDRESKFLFTGDIGFAPLDKPVLVMESLSACMDGMKQIHERLMASSKALKIWVDRVRGYEVEAVLPQHGAIIPKGEISRFFNFLEGLKCGVDLM